MANINFFSSFLNEEVETDQYQLGSYLGQGASSDISDTSIGFYLLDLSQCQKFDIDDFGPKLFFSSFLKEEVETDQYQQGSYLGQDASSDISGIWIGSYLLDLSQCQNFTKFGNFQFFSPPPCALPLYRFSTDSVRFSGVKPLTFSQGNFHEILQKFLNNNSKLLVQAKHENLKNCVFVFYLSS